MAFILYLWHQTQDEEDDDEEPVEEDGLLSRTRHRHRLQSKRVSVASSEGENHFSSEERRNIQNRRTKKICERKE